MRSPINDDGVPSAWPGGGGGISRKRKVISTILFYINLNKGFDGRFSLFVLDRRRRPITGTCTIYILNDLYTYIHVNVYVHDEYIIIIILYTYCGWLWAKRPQKRHFSRITLNMTGNVLRSPCGSVHYFVR